MKEFEELSLDERLNLLYNFLSFVLKNENLTTKQLRKRFSEEYGISDKLVKHIYDLLFFADFVRIKYHGFPAKPYYTLTDLGESIILKGRLTLSDFSIAPKWVVKEITKGVKLIGKYATIEIDPFTFYFDKNYVVYVVTPLEWRQSWQTNMFGKKYSVKHRTIMLLQTLQLADNYFTGYKFVSLTPYAIKKRLEHGRVLRRYRTMIFDPNDFVSVKKVKTKKNKIVWKVDFSKLKNKIKVVDKRDIIITAQLKGYNAYFSNDIA